MHGFERRHEDRRKQEPAPRAPHPCCAEFALVTRCGGVIDLFSCPVCQATWTAPCEPREPRNAA
jgi:hypothetical protein